MEEDDSDVWSKDLKCLVCRETCANESEKLEHRNTDEHMKKWAVKKFIDESLGRISIAVSQMHERYKLNKLPVIGLEECIEIQQEGFSNQEKANFWACNLCYDVGDNYDSADTHLTSMRHIKNYLDDYDSERNEEIEKECKDECEKYEKYRSTAEEIFKNTGGIQGIQSPQILRLDLSTIDGRKKLGIKEQDDVTFRPHKSYAQGSVLHCSTCNELSPVQTTGKYTNERARAAHCESANHQRCSAILAMMKEFDLHEFYDEFKTSESQADLRWLEKEPNMWYLSQPCGYRYSIRAGKETLCIVCFALVQTDHFLEHSSSEYHAMKFLGMTNTFDTYLAQQFSGSERRSKALKILLSTLTLDNDMKVVARKLSRLPNVIKSQLSEDLRVYEDPPVETIDDFIETTGKVYRFCHSCTTFMEFDANLVDTPTKMNAVWKSHISSLKHFELAAMRARIHFDPKYFVPYSPTIHNSDTDIKGVWKVNKDVLVQTQCDVGLEFMVEDEQANEVTCQCCWKVFSKNPIFVNQHIRSYDHLKQYIFLTAPDLVRTLLGPEQDSKKQEFLMDWLQRHSGLFQKRINLYSKLKTSELSSWTPVSRRMVQLSLLPENSDKIVYETVLNLVDKVSCDQEEDTTISAREALIAANMLIINTTRTNQNELGSIVCRCGNCELLVVANAESWEHDIFTAHVCSNEHNRRMILCKENTMSAFGILAEKSSYTVKPFVQKDPTKKVTWQWNQATKQHDYVSSVVGLECIVERRYPGMEFDLPKQQADFYCQICAVVFQKRAATLEAHVRTIDHCINWIHKYRPSQIRDLLRHIANQAVDKGKDLRKFLSGILKEAHPPEDYCMLVYDPLGEEERKQMAILTKIQTEEKRRKMAEKKEKSEAEKAMRLKQQEEARKLTEERMKAERQKRQEEERVKLAEREARYQYAKEHVDKYRETPEETALKNRLAQANLEKQKKSIDLHQARLEAEKIKLLANNPYASVNTDPQMRMRTSSNSSFGSILNTPVGMAPPGIATPGSARFKNQQQEPPVSFFGARQPPAQPNLQSVGKPIGGFQMNIKTLPSAHPELAAFTKRPSLRGKRVDPAIHNSAIIKNKADLLNYMRRQGASEILEPSELPREFTQSVQDSPDAFGIEFVAEVICLDDPSFDSYLCTVCDCWSDPKGMFRHLSSTDHKSTYMFHKYPHYHSEVNRERNPVVRRTIFQNFTRDLKDKHVGDILNTRMKTLIDKQTIERLWPGCEEHFNQKPKSTAWTSGGFKPIAGPPIALPKVVPVSILLDDDENDSSMEIDRSVSSRKKNDNRGRDRSRSRDRSRRSRSRDYNRRQRSDSRRRSRSRSRSRSRDRYYRDRDRSRRDRRSRSRTRSKSRSRSRHREHIPPKDLNEDWQKQTDSFLARVGGPVTSLPRSVEPQPIREHTPVVSDYHSKLATVRDLTNSGFIQAAKIEEIPKSPSPQPAPIVQTFSAEPSNRSKREKEEEEANIKRKVLGVLTVLENLLGEYQGQIPEHEILKMYGNFGLTPSEGEVMINNFLSENASKPNNTPTVPTTNISQSLSSLGIQLNTTPITPQYNQVPQYPQHAGSSTQQQYGISSQPGTSTAYSQAFHSSAPRPLSPISASIVPMPYPTRQPQIQQQYSQPVQPFYQNPPTAINHEGNSSLSSGAPVTNDNGRSNDSDDSSDDEDYKEVYQLLGTKKEDTSKQKKQSVESSPAKIVLEKPKVDEPIIPGQRMALKRTILPNGARVGEKPATLITISSPTPSDASSSNHAVITSNAGSTNTTPVKTIPQTAPPLLETSLGIPAPFAVTKEVPQQPQMMMYQNQQPQQGYQMNPAVNQFQQQPVYHQQPMQQPMQYQQQMYPPQQNHAQYPPQYGIQQQVYQQQPPQQPAYHQPMYQPTVQHYQPQQQYYQQQPPVQQPPPQGNVAPSYGISGASEQFYSMKWPPQ